MKRKHIKFLKIIISINKMSYINSLKLNNVDYINTNTSCRLVSTNEQKKVLNYINTNDEILDIQDPEILNMFNEKRSLELKIKQLQLDIKNIYNNLPEPCKNIENDELCNINIETREQINTKKTEINNSQRQIKELVNKILIKTKMFVKSNRQIEELDFYNNPYIYDNTEFWNVPYDYDNIVDEDGNILKLVGVCNPLLFDNCNNIIEGDENPMNGICRGQLRNVNINIDHNVKNSNYKNVNDLNNNLFLDNSVSTRLYKQDNNDFNINNSYKLPKGSVINDSIKDKFSFANSYCQSSKMIEKDNKFYCN